MFDTIFFEYVCVLNLHSFKMKSRGKQQHAPLISAILDGNGTTDMMVKSACVKLLLASLGSGDLASQVLFTFSHQAP